MRLHCFFAYADDREEDRQLFKLAFERAGLTNPLVLLESGPQVQAYLQGAGQFSERATYPLPSILLIDFNMPEISGVQLTAWVRAQPEFQKLIILLCSGSGEKCDVDAAYAAGANSYITKPSSVFRLATVLQTVHTYWCGVALLPSCIGDNP